MDNQKSSEAKGSNLGNQGKDSNLPNASGSGNLGSTTGAGSLNKSGQLNQGKDQYSSTGSSTARVAADYTISYPKDARLQMR